MTPSAVLLFPGLDAYAEGELRQAREEFPAIGDVMGKLDEAGPVRSSAPDSYGGGH